jgi:putative restriction endonuclease
MLDMYIEAFSRLRRSPGRNLWPEATGCRAPHKPFLLMAIMDLTARRSISDNFILPSEELEDRFALYWNQVMDVHSEPNMAQPFFHLSSEGFWNLKAVPGMEHELAAQSSIRSMAQLHRLVVGAWLDLELFDAFCNPHARERLRQVLIDTCFSTEVRPHLIAVDRQPGRRR